jgi:hypothetical protein
MIKSVSRLRYDINGEFGLTTESIIYNKNEYGGKRLMTHCLSSCENRAIALIPNKAKTIMLEE